MPSIKELAALVDQRQGEIELIRQLVGLLSSSLQAEIAGMVNLEHAFVAGEDLPAASVESFIVTVLRWQTKLEEAVAEMNGWEFDDIEGIESEEYLGEQEQEEGEEEDE